MNERKSNETLLDDTTNDPKANAGAPSAHLENRQSRRQRTRRLPHEIRAICLRNPEGKQQTQLNRLRTLMSCAKLLDRRKKAVNLNAKDIRRLVETWRATKLRSATIRFRLTCLRWLAGKIAKPHIVGTDRDYGVDRGKKCKT
jgi:hypothetical protein